MLAFRVRALDPLRPAGRSGLMLRVLLVLLALAAALAAGPAAAEDALPPEVAPLAEHWAAGDGGADADGTVEERAAAALAPPALGSPRETLLSFRANAQESARAILEALEIARSDGTLLDTPESTALRWKAGQATLRAVKALDLSQVPPASRRNVGIVTTLMLEEVLERLPLPDAADIPGPAAVAAGEAPPVWTVPSTEIRLVRTETAPGIFQYLFSPETVDRVPSFYRQVRGLPDTDPYGLDFFHAYTVAPGPLAPFDFYFFILSLPDWVVVEYFDQAIWQWIALVLLTVVSLGVVWLLRRWDRRRSMSLDPRARALSRLILPLAMLATVFIFSLLADDFINVTGAVLENIEFITELLKTVIAAWLAVLGFNLVAELFASAPRAGPQTLDASLVRLAVRVVGMITAGTILIYGASRVGIPVYGIVAGLGVGGLAIALAVRPTLENFIGGIILYADRPVKTGDFCRFGDMLGTVETIGLRSTKIRALDRTLITVQNAEFAQMRIVNFTRRDQNLFNPTLSLRYETTREQLAAIMADLEAMLAAHPDVVEDTVRVRFRALATWALEVEIFAYVTEPEWGPVLKIQQDLLVRCMEIVERHGSGFAIPAHTAYLAEDARAAAAREDRPRLAARLEGTEAGE